MLKPKDLLVSLEQGDRTELWLDDDRSRDAVSDGGNTIDFNQYAEAMMRQRIPGTIVFPDTNAAQLAAQRNQGIFGRLMGGL